MDANDLVLYTAINEAVMLTAGLKATTDEFNKKKRRLGVVRPSADSKGGKHGE